MNEHSSAVSSAEKIMLCIMISIASVFYFYEERYPFTQIINIAMTAAMSAVWISSSFSAGREGRKAFAVFALIYWNVPYIFTIYYSARDNIAHYSRLLSMTNRICKALISAPFAYISELTGIGMGAFPVILLALSAAAYAAGMSASPSDHEKEESGGENNA